MRPCDANRTTRIYSAREKRITNEHGLRDRYNMKRQREKNTPFHLLCDNPNM